MLKKLNILLVFAFILFLPKITLATEGTIFFSSGAGTWQTGKEISTRLMVNSGGGAGINAAETKIKFDPKYLSVKSISQTGSIFELWPVKPKFDNKTGTIEFSGGNPKAYKDGAGKIFDVTFKVLTKGKTTVSFGTSSMMSAEENPKNVTKDRRDAVYYLGSSYDVTKANDLAQKLAGKILLQVERNGEAWYVNPKDNYRYFLGRPVDAFNIMRKLGLGAKHSVITGYKTFPKSLSGKILIDVEDKGKAYYIYPVDRKAYYLGRPDDAFAIMRKLGLGISNTDIYKLKDWVI